MTQSISASYAAGPVINQDRNAPAATGFHLKKEASITVSNTDDKTGVTDQVTLSADVSYSAVFDESTKKTYHTAHGDVTFETGKLVSSGSVTITDSKSAGSGDPADSAAPSSAASSSAVPASQSKTYDLSKTPDLQAQAASDGLSAALQILDQGAAADANKADDGAGAAASLFRSLNIIA